ncbi:PBP domain containing protein, partial [Asbolus verrucosus]
MEQTMQQDGIVPDAVEEEPSSKITISYSSGKSVEFGQELSPTDVKDEPEVKWEADPAKYYTLVMFDADGPNKEEPKFGDIKHWLVVNILGCDLSSGDVIAEYIGAEPSQGSGLHRYIFLVFEQKEKTTFDEPK